MPRLPGHEHYNWFQGRPLFVLAKEAETRILAECARLRHRVVSDRRPAQAELFEPVSPMVARIANPNHPLDGAFKRVDRAEEHLAELNLHLADFRQRYFNAATIQFDPDPPYHARAIHPSLTPDSEHVISIVTGEVCYNLRSALDYLVFELARLDSGRTQNGTQFPIDDTPKRFAEHKATRLAGISAAHVAAIERLQPYRGVKWTEILRTLSNPDKHRELTPRGGTFILEIVPDGFRPWVASNISAMRRTRRPDGAEVDVQLIAAILVTVPVLDTDTVPLGNPVEETLETLILEIRNVLDRFRPEFEG